MVGSTITFRAIEPMELINRYSLDVKSGIPAGLLALCLEHCFWPVVAAQSPVTVGDLGAGAAEWAVTEQACEEVPEPPGTVADLMLQIHAFSQGLPWGKGWAAASEDEFEKSLAYVAVRARDYIAQVLENGPHEKPRVMRGDVRLVYGQSLSALPPKEDNP